ncbi:MAG: hypothetical protein KY434_06475 [Actinobacteria bacterium]|nr:hypothetical protein [Actinomycetota bacterium]
MSRVAVSGVAAAALLAAAVLGLLAARPAPASAQSGGCPEPDGVTVVVDFQTLGRDTIVACAPGTPTSGFEALTQAAIAYRTLTSNPGFLCQIEGLPADEDCVDTPPADAYWSYWHAERGGQWRYATSGAAGRTPPPGSVEGWSFSTDPTAGDRMPPRTPPPAAPADDQGGAGPTAGSSPAAEPTAAPAPPAVPDAPPATGEGADQPVAAQPTGEEATSESPDDQPPQSAPAAATPSTATPSTATPLPATPSPATPSPATPTAAPAARPGFDPSASAVPADPPASETGDEATEVAVAASGGVAAPLEVTAEGPPTGALVGLGAAAAISAAALVVVSRRGRRGP